MMKLPKYLSFFLFCLFAFFPSLDVFPQASVNVSTLDPVYRDIDKLVAHGLVDKIIVGQRPYSRKEIARITAEAMRHMLRIERPLEDPQIPENKKEGLRARKAYVDEILNRLKRDYHEELVLLGAMEGEKSWYSLHPVEKATVDMVFAASPPHPIAVDNGLGRIDAVVNPLLDYREGRHLVEGSNLSLETTHWARVTNHLAFFAQPRFQLALSAEEGPNDNHVYLMNLYGKLYVKNFEIEVGRDNLVWAQGQNAGLLLSKNARGLDMVKLSNDSPFFLPWVFKYLGPNKFSFFYGNLGPEQNFPYAYLLGYKWNFEPFSWFEWGFGMTIQSGGRGSVPASLGQRVVDAIPIVNYIATVEIGNKFAGIDFKFRVPQIRNTEFFGEIIFDDIYPPTSFTNIKNFFQQDTGYIGGFYIPRLIDSGKLDFRFEFHRTAYRYYRHGQFKSGYTENRFLLGDNLGPNAHGAYATINWDVGSRNLLTFDGAYELRSSSIFGVFPGFNFVVIQKNPEEQRFRGTVSWLHRSEDFPLSIFLRAGYEHVRNFNYVGGDSKNNFLGQIAFQFDFDKWIQRPR